MIRKSFNVTVMALCFCALTNKINAQQFGGGDGSPADPYQIASPEHLAQLAGYVNTKNTNYNNKHYILTADIDLSIYDSNNTAFNNGKGWKPIGCNLGGANYNGFEGNFNGNNKQITNLYINEDSIYFAGLFGVVWGGTIKNLCVSAINIKAKNYVGGVAGYVVGGSVITNCCSTGEISGGDDLGGVAGSISNSAVTNCYSTSKVSGYFEVGGVVGSVWYNSRLTNCYSIGEVSGMTAIGGVAGNVYSNNIASNCAALNKSVKATNTAISRAGGRITRAKQTDAVLSNNIAFNRMLNRVGNTTWSEKGLDQADGGDITAQQIEENGSLLSLFVPSDSTWTVVNGYLPGLFGKVVEIPLHLLYNAPPAVIVQQPQDATVTVGTAHTLSVAATAFEGTEGSLSYRWYSNSTQTNTGGSAIAEATNSTYQPPTTDEGEFYYYVEVIYYMEDNGNGGNLMSIAASRAVRFTVQEDGTGIEQWEMENGKWKIYPNPVKSQLIIENEEGKIESVEIYDMIGKVVTNFQLSTFNSQLNIDVSHLAKGVYFLKVDGKMVRFVKE